ncbi:MAG: hypothetical protein QOG00_3295 [Pyrinomonadaceae bacterium]|jgi:hypothetical protein|nr:hypothetical protein [Pyrinomonadaceae bacterium]
MATKKKASSSKSAKGSGATQFTAGEGQVSLKVSGVSGGVGAGGASLTTFFGRMSPDPAPGWNTLTISGMPLNTRVITVWVTEWVAGNYSHAGQAWLSTDSVQLYNQGRNCRVRFYLNWVARLPSGAMIIYGPG